MERPRSNTDSLLCPKSLFLARGSPARLSPSRLSPRMACVPEHDFITSPADSSGTSGEECSSPLSLDCEPRPRVFSFPSSVAKQEETRKQFSQVANWNRDQWTPVRQRRKKSPEQTAMSLAEREFLSNADSRTYQRIRSFKSTRKGHLIDCGYCYIRRHSSCGEEERPREPILLAEPTPTPALNSRRMTCPEIWLSRAESFTPKVFRYEIAIIGNPNVGKGTLIRALMKECDTDVDSIEGGVESEDGVVTMLLNKHEVQLKLTNVPDIQTIVSNEDDADDEECLNRLFVIMYSVVNRTSFRAAGKSLYALYEEPENRDKEDKLLAVLVGNKMDLERKRKVKESEGRTMSRIYRCPFLETSASLSLNSEKLVKELLHIIESQIDDGGDDELLETHPGVPQGRRDSAGHRFLNRLRVNGRRLARSCEELFSKLGL